jgi:hypothetical protein
MAGRTIERLACKCKPDGQSIQVFLNNDDTYSGFCYSCNQGKGRFIADPYGEGKKPDPKNFPTKTPEEIAEEIAVIRNCPHVANYRSINATDWKYHGVRLIYSEYDGKTPTGIAHPYTRDGVCVGYKIKLFALNLKGKKIQWSVGETRDADPYGWHKAKSLGARVLYITEGEEDAISLRQMLMSGNRGDYIGTEYAVISLPNGAQSVSKLGRISEDIDKLFEKIVLVYDGDEEGEKAALETRKMFPEAHSAKLPLKDANACLEDGKIKAATAAVLFRAKKQAPTEVKKFSSIIKDALAPIAMGVSFPWPTVTKKLYGQRKPNVIGLGAGTGLGKTTMLHELGAWNARKHGWRSLMILMEETNEESLRYICGKIDNIPYNTPELKYDQQQLRRTANNLEPYIDVWNPDNNGDPYETWEAMKRAIRRDGDLYDEVVLDNLTVLSEGIPSSEKNEFIGKVAKESADLSLKFNLQIVLVSHLNAPAKGQRPHENGGVVHESQFTGSRGLMRYCTLMMGFERNKYAKDPQCSFITCFKVRKAGKTFRVKTYYNEDTGRLEERQWEDTQYHDDKIDMGKKSQG